MTYATTHFLNRALPREGETMPILYRADGSAVVRVAYRQDGTASWKQRTVPADQAEQTENNLRREIAELTALVRQVVVQPQPEKRSLTVGECIRTYTRDNGYGGMACNFRMLEKDLGTCIADRSFAPQFASYFSGLSNSLGTIQRKKACLRMTFNYCVGLGLLETSPITDYRMKPEEPRNRILTEAEEKRLVETLTRYQSYLLAPVRFSLLNPVRRSDLINLSTDNLDLERGYVWCKQGKTQFTYFIVWDEWLRSYFHNHKGGWLFPGYGGNRIGDFKRHWATMLRESKIKDFRFHDLRHCAATRMIENGFSDRDLIDLGLWKSISMITRYHGGNAHRVLSRYQARTATTATVAVAS